MLVLAGQDAPTRTTLCAGAGSFEAANVTLTRGLHLGIGPQVPDALLAHLDTVRERGGETVPGSGAEQGANEMRLARAAR